MKQSNFKYVFIVLCCTLLCACEQNSSVKQKSGTFFVSPTQKVCFSPGNLQYKASTRECRFAEHQYDFIGEENEKISATYDGWIDLFCWGTGDNPARHYLHDVSIGLFDNFVDWGIRRIDNYPQNTWRTLSSEEWVYLFNTHQHSVATIDTIHGVIILPSKFRMPKGIQFVTNADKWDTNLYSVEDWKKLENNGAIFLPAAGCWEEDFVESVQELGAYWSSTFICWNHSYNLFFGEYGIYPDCEDNDGNNDGMSVRLVRDL